MPTLNTADIPSIVAKIDVKTVAKKANPIVANVVKDFGRRAVERIDEDAIFRPDRRVSAFVRQMQGRWIGVNRTTQRSIARTIASGLDSGYTVDEIARSVAGKFDAISRGRGYNIARTTVSQASNFATKEGYRQAGVERKEWLTTVGGDSRPSHEAMDGQQRTIDETFDSPNGGSAQYPGDFGDPSEDVNCQCSVLPVIDERGLRPGDRVKTWKAFERLRAPYTRQMRIAISKGLAAQKSIVISAIRSYDDVAAAA